MTMTTGLYEIWLLHLSKEKWNGNSIFQEINKELKKQISRVVQSEILSHIVVSGTYICHSIWPCRNPLTIWGGWHFLADLMAIMHRQSSGQLTVYSWVYSSPTHHVPPYIAVYISIIIITTRHANSVPVPLYSLPRLVPYIVYYTVFTIYTGIGGNEWTSERFRTWP